MLQEQGLWHQSNNLKSFPLFLINNKLGEEEERDIFSNPDIYYRKGGSISSLTGIWREFSSMPIPLD